MPRHRVGKEERDNFTRTTDVDYETAKAVIRALSEFLDDIETEGSFPSKYNRIRNVQIAFAKTLPKHVQADLLHG